MLQEEAIRNYSWLCDMTLSNSKPELWLFLIKEHTLKSFKSILASCEPLTDRRMSALLRHSCVVLPLEAMKKKEFRP